MEGFRDVEIYRRLRVDWEDFSIGRVLIFVVFVDFRVVFYFFMNIYFSKVLGVLIFSFFWDLLV